MLDQFYWQALRTCPEGEFALNKSVSANTRSAILRVVIGVPLVAAIAYGLLMGGIYLLFTLTHERRPMPIEEITKRTGLRFPAGTVLIGSYFDAIGMGVSYGARMHVPSQSFSQLLHSLPANREVARGTEVNHNIWKFPDTFCEQPWWTPRAMHFSLRMLLDTPSGGVLIGADETKSKYVDVLLYAEVL